jgi:4'-phosphopantetheinyl transferase
MGSMAQAEGLLRVDPWPAADLRACEALGPARRRQSLAARLLLRGLLAITAPETCGSLLATDPWGAPFLPDHPRVHVSVSHSHDQVAVAVGVGARIGIDVERVDPDPNLAAAISRYLHPRERVWLRDAWAPHPNEALHALWTAKEAAAKCVGLGLHLPGHAFWIEAPWGIGLARGLHPRVRCLALTGAEGYRAALAWQPATLT